MGATDDDRSAARRRTVVAIVAVAVLASLGIGLWAVTSDGSDPGEASGEAARPPADGATDSGEPGGAAPTVTEPSAPEADGTADNGSTVGPPVELAPVTGGNEAELCAAIVERLGEYRTAATERGVDQTLVDALDEFEAQVDTQSDDQDWGDRIVEQTTNVRREWVTGLSAAEQGDDSGADERFAAGIDRLDRAIDEAGCPTS